jgi:hypothetical protein
MAVGRRKERDARAWSLAVLVTTSCFEPPDPPWLLDGSVEILAVRTEVIVDSADASTIAPVPADRFRAEALPGDTIRASLIAASRFEVAPPEEIDARWFLCRDLGCVNEVRDDAMLHPCTGVLEAGQGCSLGSGSATTFQLPPLVPYVPSLGPADVQVGVVLGTSGGLDTSQCVSRLRERPYPSLAGCSLFQHVVYGGPTWKIVELIGLDVDPDNAPPDQLRYIPPNFNPEVERFDVTIRDDQGSRQVVVESGGRVSVAAGERVRFGVQVDPRDLQHYVASYGDEIVTTEEVLQFDYFADVAVATSTEDWFEPEISWTVPDDVDSVSFVATLDDMRGGIGWGTISFDVAGVAP